MAILFVGENGSLKNGTDACRDTYRNFIFGSTKFTAKAINDSLTIRLLFLFLVTGVRHLDHQ